MDDDQERAHAKMVRLKARLTWVVIMAALMLVMGPARLTGLPKAAVIALMLGAVAALNVPSFDVVQRARREGAPANLVRILAVTLAMRLIAAVVVAALLW